MSIAPTTLFVALAELVALTAVLLAVSLRNPRLGLHKYPKDIQAAVPPKTPAERRETLWWSMLILALVLGGPPAAAVLAKLQQPDLGFIGAFSNAAVVLLAFNLFDWLVLDWLVFCTLTPGFIVIPGTRGMAGYKDYLMHFRGFLAGLVLTVVASAVIGVVVVLVRL